MPLELSEKPLKLVFEPTLSPLCQVLEDVGYPYLDSSKYRKRKTKVELVKEIRRRKELGDLPPVFPNGWFTLLDSSDIKVDQVKHVQALGNTHFINYSLFTYENISPDRFPFYIVIRQNNVLYRSLFSKTIKKCNITVVFIFKKLVVLTMGLQKTTKIGVKLQCNDLY